MAIIIDSTNHGQPEILRIDIKRLLSNQENWDSAIPQLVDPSNRRKVQPEIWIKNVIPIAKENSIDLKIVRGWNGYLYMNKEDIPSKEVDPYAVEGCTMQSS